MAQTQSSETGGWGAGLKDLLQNAASLVVTNEIAKRYDVETTQDGNNVPGREDLIEGSNVTGNATGTINNKFLGLNYSQWGIAGLVIVGVGFVAKKVI